MVKGAWARFAGACLAVSLHAQAAHELPGFADLDVNEDGFISRWEAMMLPCLMDAYDEFASDPEAGLTREEYYAAIGRSCRGD